MRTDRDIELEITKKVQKLEDKIWKISEKILASEYRIKRNWERLKENKYDRKGSRKKLQIAITALCRSLGNDAKIDAELDEEFDDVNMIEHLSKITLGIISLET